MIIHKKQISRESNGQVTDVYKISIVNLGRNGFLLLKRQKHRQMDFAANDQLLADKVKLVINQKGEVILISTSLTVLRVEIDEE